jgi:hypothetical protein
VGDRFPQSVDASLECEVSSLGNSRSPGPPGADVSTFVSCRRSRFWWNRRQAVFNVDSRFRLAGAPLPAASLSTRPSTRLVRRADCCCSGHERCCCHPPHWRPPRTHSCCRVGLSLTSHTSPPRAHCCEADYFCRHLTPALPKLTKLTVAAVRLTVAASTAFSGLRRYRAFRER